MFVSGLTVGLSPALLICALLLSGSGYALIPWYLVGVVGVIVFPGAFLLPLLPIGYGLWRKGIWDWFSVGAGLALAIIVVVFFVFRLFVFATAN